MGCKPMLLPQEIEVGINYKNIDYYRNLGYQIEKCSTVINVNINHLAKNSHKKVKILCDYCKETFERVFRDYLKFKDKSPIKKDCCVKCRGTKTKESNLIVYGVENVANVEEVVEKRKATNIERFGAENPFQSKEIIQKIEKTIMKKYGVKNVFESKEIIEKIQKKNLEKYGYKYASMHPDVRDRITENYVKSMYSNGTSPASKPQRYIHKCLGGELNYPVGKLMLDVAFVESKIYIEYQGSGHDLSVKMGKMTKDEFQKRENNRYYYLRNKGWKMIEIISTSQYDFLPEEKVLEEMLTLSRNLFISENSSFVSFNIADSTIRTSKYINPFEFGELVNMRKLA